MAVFKTQRIVMAPIKKNQSKRCKIKSRLKVSNDWGQVIKGCVEHKAQTRTHPRSICYYPGRREQFQGFGPLSSFLNLFLLLPYSACSLVGFSQPKPASQQYFPLTKNSTSQPKPVPTPTSEQAHFQHLQ